MSKRTLFSLLFTLIAVPVTVFSGTFFLQDRKYYFISLLVIIETLVPFFISFESKKPKARELIIISVLCALAIAGRMAFYMLPQFKPVMALVILSAVAFGGETGFLVGSVSAFVSNFFFTQGPWTPWQMLAFGMVGLFAGLLFHKKSCSHNRIVLSIYGLLATVMIYGVIADVSSLFQFVPSPTWEFLVDTLILGLPFNLIHGASTILFLWFLTDPILEKLDRIKTKYNL